MRYQRGFTLIELMIVVAIIAILAAIAISQYQDYLVRTQVAEGSSLADGAKTAVGEFVNSYGRFSSSGNASYGLASSASIVGKYVASVSINNGVIVATFNNTNANTAIQGKTLSFSPVTHAGSIEWVCNPATSMNVKYVPAVCRN